jgi:hypothetical protein
MITRSFHVGDRLVSLLADLYEADGRTPIVLGAAETVAFRMVLISDGTVKVNNSAAAVVSRGDALTLTPAQVRYDWAAADVDTAGEYAAWFIRTSAGQTEHFPIQDHADPQFTIIFYADS